jgi:hypothetical protein
MPIALRQKGRVDAALFHYNAISCISAARLPAEKFDDAVSLTKDDLADGRDDRTAIY